MAGLVENKVAKYLEKIKKEDKKINSFLFLNPNVLNEAKNVDGKSKKGRLYGYVFGVKANINVVGMPISCASETLKDYIGTYDASVIEKIKAEDGVIIGILNMDEFACGSSGETSAFGVCENPAAPGKIPGGSSSGCAAAVAAGFCDVALGSDTGGSIRNPASNCGVVGVKPSYGLVSRHGLIDLSMSLDQVGPVAKNVEDATKVLDVIRGKDARDPKTFDSDEIKFEKIKKPVLGIVNVEGVDLEIQKLFNSNIEKLREAGWEVREVKIKDISLAVQAYYLIVYSEFYSGTRRFDGRRYGKKIEDFSGEEVLRRIFGGSEITRAEFEGKYYERALKVKELISEEISEVLSKLDALVMPTVPKLPWDVGEGEKMKPEEIYAYDSLTIPANLADACAVSIPSGNVNKIPVGMQVLCRKAEDGKMLSIAREIEKII